MILISLSVILVKTSPQHCHFKTKPPTPPPRMGVWPKSKMAQRFILLVHTPWPLKRVCFCCFLFRSPPKIDDFAACALPTPLRKWYVGLMKFLVDWSIVQDVLSRSICISFFWHSNRKTCSRVKYTTPENGNKNERHKLSESMRSGMIIQRDRMCNVDLRCGQCDAECVISDAVQNDNNGVNNIN